VLCRIASNPAGRLISASRHSQVFLDPGALSECLRLLAELARSRQPGQITAGLALEDSLALYSQV
jgi:hypothetical protein